jgi:hypothetical protein
MMPNKRFIIMLAAAILLLILPLVAMQFTHEVKWSTFDFLLMGFMLLATATACELVLRKVKSTPNDYLFAVRFCSYSY